MQQEQTMCLCEAQASLPDSTASVAHRGDSMSMKSMLWIPGGTAQHEQEHAHATLGLLGQLYGVCRVYITDRCVWWLVEFTGQTVVFRNWCRLLSGPQ